MWVWHFPRKHSLASLQAGERRGRGSRQAGRSVAVGRSRLTAGWGGRVGLLASCCRYGCVALFVDDIGETPFQRTEYVLVDVQVQMSSWLFGHCFVG